MSAGLILPRFRQCAPWSKAASTKSRASAAAVKRAVKSEGNSRQAVEKKLSK
jgi:hypothetical protein